MSIAYLIDCRSLGLPRFEHDVNHSSLKSFPPQAPIFQKDVYAHTGCVNSVEYSMDENYLLSGGDDRRVLMWSIADLLKDEAPSPLQIMNTMHLSNIFAVKFSNDGRLAFSGSNDMTMFAHVVETGQKMFTNHIMGAVHNIDSSPISDYEISICRSSSHNVAFIDLRDYREPLDVLKVPGMSCAYSGQYNPGNAALYAVAGEQRGLVIYDRRFMNKAYLDLGYTGANADSMFGRWSNDGNAIVNLVPHSYPVYIDLLNNRRVRLKDSKYTNHHTIKSVSFLDDKTVVTGGDGFEIFLWNIEEKKPNSSINETGMFVMEKQESADRILEGHRSIVNHVRYSPVNNVIISSGVEKIVKLWSPLDLPGSYSTPRLRIPASTSSSFTEDYESEATPETTEEDLNMLRYFDRLVLRNTLDMEETTLLERGPNDPDSVYSHYDIGDRSSAERRVVVSSDSSSVSSSDMMNDLDEEEEDEEESCDEGEDGADEQRHPWEEETDEENERIIQAFMATDGTMSAREREMLRAVLYAPEPTENTRRDTSTIAEFMRMFPRRRERRDDEEERPSPSC